MLKGNYDFIVVHDPQPAALLHYYYTKDKTFWIWRSHIDTSKPNLQVWDFFQHFLEEYDAVIFTAKSFAHFDIPIKKVVFIPPAIDPLSPKNRKIDIQKCKRIIKNLGIDIKRPLITQVSRLDPWKDPCALLAQTADDDPEGFRIYKKVKKHIGKDRDIHLLVNLPNNDIKVNAFQRASDIILQKSIREVFGLTISEAMWKGNIVIGGEVGGIPIQIIDGKTGFLVKNIKECAQRIIDILNAPKEEIDIIKKQAQEYVRRNFLLPRLLFSELKLFDALAKTKRR